MTTKIKNGDKVIVVSTKHAGSAVIGRPDDYYYKEGWVGVVRSVWAEALTVDFSGYRGPLAIPSVGVEDVALATPVLIAEYNLKKAQAELDAAKEVEAKAEAELKAAEEAAKRFTEADVKSFLVVSYEDNTLRLLTIEHGNCVLWDTTGSRSNGFSRESAVYELNLLYTKTDKTLKDFANA